MIPKEKIMPYLCPKTPIPTAMSFSGHRLAGIQCVMFDVYGTLFISESGDIGMLKRSLAESGQVSALLTEFGIARDAKAVLEAFFAEIDHTHVRMKKAGVPFPEVCIDDIWMSVLGTSDRGEARDFAARFEMIVNPVYPMPHLAEVFKKLKENKVRMGIVSNAQFYTPLLFQWFLGGTLEHLGFDRDLLVWSYRKGMAKPDKRLFAHAASRLAVVGILPENVLYLGNDMKNDIYPAAAQGFRTALFAGDERSLRLREDIPHLRDLVPDAVLTDLAQLFLILP